MHCFGVKTLLGTLFAAPLLKAGNGTRLAQCRGQLRALGLYGTAFPRRGERSRSQLLFGEDHFVQQLYNCGFQVLGCIHLFERARGTNH